MTHLPDRNAHITQPEISEPQSYRWAFEEGEEERLMQTPIYMCNPALPSMRSATHVRMDVTHLEG